MAFTHDDISINTLIGAGTKVEGNIAINGFVRIDGDIKGDIETEGNIIVGENARILGNIKANSVTVGGIVFGNINAEKQIKLLSNSIVLGDLTAQKLELEDGIFFQGHCISLSDKDEFEKAKKNFTEQKAIQSRVM